MECKKKNEKGVKGKAVGREGGIYSTVKCKESGEIANSDTVKWSAVQYKISKSTILF